MAEFIAVKGNISTEIKQVLIDLPDIKQSLLEVGVMMDNKKSCEYSDSIRSLKPTLDSVPVLEEQVNNLTEQVDNLEEQLDIDENHFNNIYEAIVEKGGEPIQEDIYTYAEVIRDLPIQKPIGNLSYYFWNDYRAVDDYWDLVKDTVNSMLHMLDTTTLTGGKTYVIDMIGCSSTEYLMFNTKINTAESNSVDINLVIGNNITSLANMINADILINTNENKYFNIVFGELSDLSNITNLDNAFRYTVFGSLDLSKLSNAPITSMIRTFEYSGVSVECDFNLLDTSNVSTFNYCFSNYGRGLIKELDISDWVFKDNTNLSYMFNGMNSITKLTLPDNLVITNQNCNNMFNGCKAISDLSLTITDDNTATNSDIFQNMFYACSGLKNIVSDKWILHRTTYYMFSNCSSLVSVPEIEVHIHNASNKKNLQYMYNLCTSLEEVKINIIYDEQANVNFAYMFNGDTKLKKILGNLDLSCVDSVTSIFKNCSSLEYFETTGSFGGSSTASSLTLDVSASSLFNIYKQLEMLASNGSGKTRIIKLHADVYNNLTDETLVLATEKNYTLASS